MCRAPSDRVRARDRTPRRTRRAHTRRGAPRALRARDRPSIPLPCCRRSLTRSRISAGARPRWSSTSRSRSGRSDASMGSPVGLVARSGPQRRSANARAHPSRALIAAARCRSLPVPSAILRASWNVETTEPAKRAARASASSSSYCAARRMRLPRPSSRSSGVPLGVVDGVGQRSRFDPATRFVRRPGTRDAPSRGARRIGSISRCMS